MQYVRAMALGVSLLVAACGQRHINDSPSDTNPAGELAGTPCIDASDCGGGACVNETCVDDNNATTDPTGSTGPTAPASCVDDGDCAANQYCQYPAMSPWVAGTEGACKAPCGQCPFGQTCYSGQCYSEIDCDPSVNSSDCPPGEVCSTQTHTCSVPPSNCYFNEQCPAGWVCNTDNTCLDPDTINLGGCTADADCNAVAGCQGGICTCDDGACRPNAGCDGAGDCPQGTYCAAGTCLSAIACTGQDTCTPYGLVCSGGYCTNAAPCTNGTCPAGQVCQSNYVPPACFPQGTNACVRDDQCPQGKYCELFTGQCLTGCRGDLDCAAPTPYCSSAHVCTPNAPGTAGDACSDDSACPGGTVCAYDDPAMGIFCSSGMPVGTCTRSCRVVCDLLTAQVMDTCPAGTACGGADQMTAIIMNLFQTLFGATSTSASACY